jgi:single-strand DNA-binding protein
MANLNLNKVILCGRLTNNVELKQTPSGLPVCTFALAINRKTAKDQPQKADFIKCVAWRQTAEFISRYFGKGSSLCVVGSIQTRTWKDDNGYSRESVEILVEEAMFVDSKSEVGNHDAPTFASQGPTAPKFEELKTDEDLPF